MAQGKKNNDMTNGNSKYQQPSLPPKRKDGSTNGSKSEGRLSDTAISGGRYQGERALQKWVPDTSGTFDDSLETSLNKTGIIWDQFAENKRLFGITTDYNENIYTTVINKNHPQYKQRVAEADRKAREIERSATLNSHVAEERILNNVDGSNATLDEEDKYSGVQRTQNIPSIQSPTHNKYLPPARRAAAGQSLNYSAPIGPVAASQIPRLEKSSSEAKPLVKSSIDGVKFQKSDNVISSTNSNPSSIPELRPNFNSTSPKRKVSPKTKNEGLPNATATVERDVASAFKNFASQQRKNVDQIRITRAKNDKEVKLNDLKAFANSFKLHTPVPSDLVPIIAKDPKKQKEIQAKAQRNAEEAEATKVITQESKKSSSFLSEIRTNKSTPLSHGPSSTNLAVRQNSGPNTNFTHNSFRGSSHQSSNQQQNRSSIGNYMKGFDQPKTNQLSQNQTPIDLKPLPTGPSNNIDINLSRPVGPLNSHPARLNPNSSEFRPSPHAASFNPSTGSSPRSIITAAIPAPRNRSIIRRKPIPFDERPSILDNFDTLKFIKSLAAPAGKELAWKATGGIRPAYDTQPVWKQTTAEDRADCPIRLTYSQVFESAPFTSSLFSPNQTHILSQFPQHQHHSIHLSHVAHNIGARQSPHQVSMNTHGVHQAPNSFGNSHDDHRMLPSQSAQSFASPRLQTTPMAYASPINQAAQLAYNPQIIQYSSGPQVQAGYRPVSSNHQFMPQQNPMSQMMISNLNGTFVATQNLTPGPQIMFQGNQPPPYMPATNGNPPLMSNVNGYPSPGRSAPMMVNQGSQQGPPQQPVYGMNPGISSGPGYGNPIYSQQPPSQLPMRPFVGPNNQQHGTSNHSFHHFIPPNRRNNQNNPNFYPAKSFQHNQTQNTVTNNQMPVISQPRRIEGNDETK